MAKKKWIAGMKLREGAFTRQAKAAGEGVQEYAADVLAKGSKASGTTKKRAVLARTFAKISHKKPRRKRGLASARG